MKPSKKTYALTGVTGLLGRNVFFEIVKDNINNLNNIEIIIFGRGTAKETLKERIKSIFYSEGVNYLSINPKIFSRFELFLETNIIYVNINLYNPEIISAAEHSKLLKIKQSIDFFFHIAASTDFRNNPNTIRLLDQQNVNGTDQVLKLCEDLNINEFCYVSSAYVCGLTYGNILPNYTNLNQDFRNYYEKTKLKGELLVKEYQQRTGVRCRIFRPSTISGNLIENEKGTTYKFDVFYGWIAYFLRVKMKMLNDIKDINAIYDKEISLDIRIAINSNAGLNIVPADFAAKVMHQVCKQDIDGDYFHLVNNQETHHPFYIKNFLKLLNIIGYKFVENIPEDLNVQEELFYKTVGSIFTPYINQKEINFNVDNLQKLYAEQNLSCPEINQKNLQILLEFAKSKNFGLVTKKSC